MLFTLAIFPSIALLIYVYKMDKKEKEPLKFLWRLFLLGVVLAIPVAIVETILDEALLAFTIQGSFFYAIFEGFVVAACTEELGKYILLKKNTWNSKYFDCMFDGIVYSVFVSLGFASIENIVYVLSDGISTAIMRMFSAVPGHTCFAIYMGYYYSLSKLCINKGNIIESKKYRRKAVIVPIILHGIYDSLIMLDESVCGDVLTTIAIIIWVFFVVTFYVRAFMQVAKASKNDDYIVYHEEGWKCDCGRICYGNYCANCGGAKK